MPIDLLEAAKTLIAVDTVSAHGNLALREPLTAYAKALGLTLTVLEETVAGVPNANFLFSRPAAARSREGPLLLVTHTDTVPPGPLEHWTATPPFTAKVDGDKLYGLGSADVKIDLLCKLTALERVARADLSRDVFLVGTFAEEIGLLGAKRFAKSGPVKPRFVVCGEPSQLTIIHAHKGYLVARVTLAEPVQGPVEGPAPQGQAEARTVVFTGKAAHSSTPHLGDNAIVKALREPLDGLCAIHGGQSANSVPASCSVELALDGVTQLPVAAARYVISRFTTLVSVLSPRRDDRFAPAEAVSNVGFIEGRIASGQGRLELLLDARLLPGQAPETLMEAFEEEVKAVGGDVRFERDNPAVYTPPQSPLCIAAQAVSKDLKLVTELQTKATNTEAAAFSGQADAIVFGPGLSSGNSHCANEHMLIPQLQTAIAWYEGLIRELCG